MIQVLIPTDFSESARHAVDYALRLFPHSDFEVYLLNVYEMVHASSEMIISIDDILKRNSVEGLRKEKAQLEDEFNSLIGRIRTISKFGSLVWSIEKLIKEKHIDLILMGTRGARGLEKLVFGSNASEVVRSVELPVAVVPLAFEQKEIRRILLAINGYEKVEPESLSPLKHILKNHKAEVQILTLVQENQTGESEGNRITAVNELDHFHFTTHTLRVKDIPSSISEFASQNDTDLIVLLPHKYTVVKQMFHHSVSKELTSKTEIPVLALR